MKPHVAIVQSVFDFAIREINALEQRIVQAEDDADGMLWEQAQHVIAQLKAGLSQRHLAAHWINVRTDHPYSQSHVRNVVKVVTEYLTTQPRPRFRDCYNAVANGPNRLAYSGDFEWFTPPEYVEAARAVLGEIDLDPASTATANAVVQARQFYSVEDDGLAQDWDGRVWMNPPYATALVTRFAEKLATSVRAGRVTAAVVLVNNTTETHWFRTLSDLAAAICFPTGRVRFWKPEQVTDTPKQGQAVIYIGRDVDQFRESFRAFGEVWVRSSRETAASA